MNKTYTKLTVFIGENKIILNESKIFDINCLDEVRDYITKQLSQTYKNKEVNVLYTKWKVSGDKNTDEKIETHYFVLYFGKIKVKSKK